MQAGEEAKPQAEERHREPAKKGADLRAGARERNAEDKTTGAAVCYTGVLGCYAFNSSYQAKHRRNRLSYRTTYMFVPFWPLLSALFNRDERQKW